MGDGDAGQGNVGDEDMNAADGVDNVSVLGAGSDDDLTEQDKGYQGVVESDDDAGAEASAASEEIATPRGQTWSAHSSCHYTAPLATKLGRKKESCSTGPSSSDARGEH